MSNSRKHVQLSTPSGDPEEVLALRRDGFDRKVGTRPAPQRQHERRRAAIIVDIDGGHWTAIGILTNVSVGGALAVVTRDVELDQVLGLSMLLSQAEGRVDVTAVVRRAAHGAFGMEFVHVPVGASERLSRFIETLPRDGESWSTGSLPR